MRRVNIPNGEAKEPVAECAGYERRIEDAGGIDFQVLGIGLNGHIGFNEPAECFEAKTRYVALAKSTVCANARFFEAGKPIPKNALSMGIKTIMMAKRIMLIVTGEAKAIILKEAIAGPITPKVPASALQLHRDVTVVVDVAAASLL
jgi:glucosamine-6-phosphate deaminase